MRFWDKLRGRGKKPAGDSSRRGDGMDQEREGMAKDHAGAGEESAQEALDEVARRRVHLKT